MEDEGEKSKICGPALCDGGEEEQEELMEKEEGQDEDAAELLPDSYRRNSAEEKLLLTVAGHFQRQYSLLFPDRRPLLLCPVNECGVQKFVCTTLRPSPPCHLHLHTWRGCASFVADSLSPEFPELPSELPRSLSSPSTVLRRRTASCLEAATLLCCLLLGADYDAYCVSGYADRAMCEVDQRLQDCPLLDEAQHQQEVQGSPSDTSQQQYSVKPPRALQSRFLIQQAKKRKAREAQRLQEQLELQERLQRTSPPDRLHGLRVHCWVLVLSGSRGVEKNFFIDPLSGKDFLTDSQRFLGLESLWNHLQYYSNLQDCSTGCRDVTFDLDDASLWEPLLSAAVSWTALSTAAQEGESSILINEEEELPLTVLEMPRSWISPITHLTASTALTYRHTLYWRAELERFSGRSDGLIRRCRTFRDQHRKEMAAVTEWFSGRSDRLQVRVQKPGGWTAEHFGAGNVRQLVSLRWRAGVELQMDFDIQWTTNRPRRRLLTAGEMTEIFWHRDDFLSRRIVVFRPRLQITELERLDMRTVEQQVVQVVEYFIRDESKEPDRDVAQRVFLVPEARVEITYHLMEARILSSRRTYAMPTSGHVVPPHMVACFQLDPAEKPPAEPMRDSLQEVQDQLMVQILQSLKEVNTIFKVREEEKEQQKEEQEKKQEQEEKEEQKKQEEEEKQQEQEEEEKQQEEEEEEEEEREQEEEEEQE